MKYIPKHLVEQGSVWGRVLWVVKVQLQSGIVAQRWLNLINTSQSTFFLVRSMISASAGTTKERSCGEVGSGSRQGHVISGAVSRPCRWWPCGGANGDPSRHSGMSPADGGLEGGGKGGQQQPEFPRQHLGGRGRAACEESLCRGRVWGVPFVCRRARVHARPPAYL